MPQNDNNFSFSADCEAYATWRPLAAVPIIYSQGLFQRGGKTPDCLPLQTNALGERLRLPVPGQGQPLAPARPRVHAAQRHARFRLGQYLRDPVQTVALPESNIPHDHLRLQQPPQEPWPPK